MGKGGEAFWGFKKRGGKASNRCGKINLQAWGTEKFVSFETLGENRKERGKIQMG